MGGGGGVGEGSYIFFRHMGRQNSVFMKKMSQLLGGGFALHTPPLPITHTFSVLSILLSLEHLWFPFLKTSPGVRHILRWLLEFFCEPINWLMILV